MAVRQVNEADYLEAYNMYDNLANTGAQVSVFIGPIWLEEAVSLFLKTGTGKQPVYSYSNVFYDRLMIGRYLVTGTIGLMATESDKMAKIMQMVKNGDLQKEELTSLIEGQKTKFTESLSYRYSGSVVVEVTKENNRVRDKIARWTTSLLARKNPQFKSDRSTTLTTGSSAKTPIPDPELISAIGEDDKTSGYAERAIDFYSKKIEQNNRRIKNTEATKQVEDYVTRITREVELISCSGSDRRPFSFSLTLVKGDLTDPNAAITIYEDVEIDGTGEMKTNDDQVSVITYNIIGKRKPVLSVTEEMKTESCTILPSSLIAVITESTRKAAAKFLSSPRIGIYESQTRTEKLNDTMRFGHTGILVPEMRSYGSSASFSEIIYSFRIDPRVEGKQVASDSSLVYIDKTGKPTGEKGARLGMGGYELNNTFGRIASINIENTVPLLTAVAPVIIDRESEDESPSLLMPRYRVYGTEVGGGTPPSVLEAESFTSYSDHELSRYTKKFLWMMPFGVRSTPTVNHVMFGNKDSEENDKYLFEMAHPVNSLSYIESITGEWSEDGFSIHIACPGFIDSLDLSDTRKMSNERSTDIIPLVMKTKVSNSKNNSREVELPDRRIRGSNYVIDFSKKEGAAEITYSVAVSETSREVKPKVTDIPTQLTSSPESYVMNITHDEYSIVPLENADDALPLFFTLSVTPPAMPDTYMYRTIYVRPFIFIRKDNISEEFSRPGSGTPSEVTSSIVYANGKFTVSNYCDMSLYDGSKILSLSGNEEKLAYILSKRENGEDDQCSVDMTYDWFLEDSSGYNTPGKPITVSGVAYLRLKDMTKRTVNAYTVNPNGTGVSLSSVDLFNAYHSGALPTDQPIGVKVDIYWMIAVLPVLAGISYDEDRDNDIRLIVDGKNRMGNSVDIYNITRCDVLDYTQARIVDDKGDGSIKGRFLTYLRRFVSRITSGTDTTRYYLPTKQRINHYAAFARGYAIMLDRSYLLAEVLNLEFDGYIPESINSELKQYIHQNCDKSEWGTIKARHILHYMFGTDQTRLDEIYSVLDSVIEEELMKPGVTIISSTRNETIIKYESQIPPEKLVTYSLTAKGYREVMAAGRMPSVSAEVNEKLELNNYGE